MKTSDPAMMASVLHEMQQIKLLFSDPFKAEGFSIHRSIEQQAIERQGRIKRLTCCPNHVIEVFCPGGDPDRPRIYDLDGKLLPTPDSTLSEAEFLSVFEALCVEAMLRKAGQRQDVTAAWLCINAPKGDEIARAAGKTRTRCSTWINRHMPLKDALARVLEDAADKAAAILAARSAEQRSA